MAFNLITAGDIETRLGRALTEAEGDRVAALIVDASAAIRVYTGRPFGVETVTRRFMPYAGVVTIRQGDITAVTAVSWAGSGDALSFTWDGANRVSVSGATDPFTYNIPLTGLTNQAVDITFTYGEAEVPDAIVAVCCQMVLRALGRPAIDSGTQQESIAGYSYTVGTAAASGPVGLLPDEKALLNRYRRRGASVPTPSFR